MKPASLRIVLVCLACTITISGSAYGQPPGRVIAIIAADTIDKGTDASDQGLGASAAADAFAMKHLLEQVREANIPVQVFEAEGSNFTCERISAILSGRVASTPLQSNFLGHVASASDQSMLSIRADDTVIFYYAGHGYRSDVDKFPTLQCSGKSQRPRATDLSLSAILNTIFAMGPRLAIGIADACNVPLPPPPGEKGIGKGMPYAAPFRAEAVQQLFLKYKGMLELSGSKRGQESWYYNNISRESPFTAQFLNAVKHELFQSDMNGKFPEWSRIVADSTKPMFVNPSTGEVAHQDHTSPGFAEQDPQADQFLNDQARRLRKLP